MFRWAYDGLGGRQDDCVPAEHTAKDPESALEYVEGMERVLPAYKNAMETASYTELEPFIADFVNNYHPNGHMAVSRGMYRSGTERIYFG